jgi:hypothetical protein
MAREETKAKGAEGLPGEASVVSDGQRWRWFQATAMIGPSPVPSSLLQDDDFFFFFFYIYMKKT